MSQNTQAHVFPLHLRSNPSPHQGWDSGGGLVEIPPSSEGRLRHLAVVPSPRIALPRSPVGVLELAAESIALAVLQVSARGTVHAVARYEQRSTAGADFEHFGCLREGTISTALGAVEHLLAKAELHGAPVHAVATGAFRDASNGDELLELLARWYGLRVERLSDRARGEATYLAACREVEEGAEGGPRLVVDLGTTSLELVLGEGSAVAEVLSLPLGTRQLRRAIPSGLSGATRASWARAYARDVLGERLSSWRHAAVRRVILASGAMQAMLRSGQALEVMDASSREVSGTGLERLARLGLERGRGAQHKLGLSEDDRLIVPASTLIASTVLEKTALSVATVARSGLHEGVALRSATAAALGG